MPSLEPISDINAPLLQLPTHLCRAGVLLTTCLDYTDNYE